MHFVEKIGSVHLNCAHADIQFISDYLVEFAGQHKFHNLSFSRR